MCWRPSLIIKQYDRRPVTLHCAEGRGTGTSAYSLHRAEGRRRADVRMQVLTYIYVFTVWCVGTILLRVVNRFEPNPRLAAVLEFLILLQALRQSQAGLCASLSAPMS